MKDWLGSRERSSAKACNDTVSIPKRYTTSFEKCCSKKDSPSQMIPRPSLLREYSGFFTETTINGEKGILLSDQKNNDDMMDLLVQLCQYMPNLFLTAFSDKQAVRLLSNE